MRKAGIKMESKSRLPIRISQKVVSSFTGYMFILPFILGFLWFFLRPIIQSFIFSFSTIQIGGNGYTTSWTGWDNYLYIFLKDATFVPVLLETIGKTALEFPLILIISFFSATLLNQKFKGRAFARSIFFLPVIITSGILLRFESNSLALLSKSIADGQQFGGNEIGNFFSYNLYFFLRNTKLDINFIDYILDAISEIYSIITLSGVQILIFLSALQTIPPSLKEAAHIDGATGWEFFWKITFPMVSPFILVNLVYTIIDNFTIPTNKIIILINNTMFEDANFAVSSAMGWSYFIVIILLMGLITALLSRGVYYEND